MSVAFLLSTASAHAARFEFKVSDDGKPANGAEVCFFKGTNRDPFFGRYLQADKVACLPADKILQLPGGYWGIWAQQGATRTSAVPEYLFVDPAEGDERLYRGNFDLVPAGVVHVDGIEAGNRALVYLTNDVFPDALAAMRPTLLPSNDVVVPAEATAVPMIARGGAITCVGEPLQVASASRSVAPKCVPAAQRHDVVVWLHADVYDVPAGDLRIKLVQNGISYASLLPVNPRIFERSLVIFRGLRAGSASVSVEGTQWVGAPQTIVVQAETGVTTVKEPILLHQSPQLRVLWSVDETLRGASADVQCDESRTPAIKGAMRLLRCKSDRARDCSAIAQQDLSAETLAGEQVFRASPGEYTLELVFGNYSVRERFSQSAKGGSATMHLAAGALTGVVTRGGRPESAIIDLGGGSVRTSSGSGAFTLPLVRAVNRLAMVTVTPCDAQRTPYVTLTDRALRAGDMFDLDIPDNELVVHVVDAASGEAIQGAAVTFDLLGDDGEVLSSVELPNSDAEGATRRDSVKPNAALTVCAIATGYDGQCHNDVRVGADAKETLRLELRAKTGTAAKIRTDRPITAGVIYATSRGRVLWTSRVDADGTFSMRPGPPATLVFVSASHPLFVLPPPADLNAPLEIDLPQVPIRTATLVVNSGPVVRGNLGLSVGGEQLPEMVVDAHQLRHHQPSQFQTRVPLQINEIAETATIRVHLGYFPSEAPFTLPPDVDQFMVPEVVATLPSRVIDRALLVFSDDH